MFIPYVNDSSYLLHKVFRIKYNITHKTSRSISSHRKYSANVVGGYSYCYYCSSDNNMKNCPILHMSMLGTDICNIFETKFVYQSISLL